MRKFLALVCLFFSLTTPSIASDNSEYVAPLPPTYGAPYRAVDAYHQWIYADSEAGVIAAWWQQYQEVWSPAFPGCSYVYEHIVPQGGTVGEFVVTGYYYLQGTCAGGNLAYVSVLTAGGECPVGYERVADLCVLLPPPIDQDQVPGGQDSSDSSPPGPDADGPEDPAPTGTTPTSSGPGGDGGNGTGGGSIGCDGTVGDPINTANGNKFDVITDFAPASRSPLRLIRYYDSKMPVSGRFGANWRHHYERQVEIVSGTVVRLRRQDGKAYKFTLANGQWSANGSVGVRLESLGANAGWRVTTARDDIELYGANGELTRITARNGLTQDMAYTAGGLLNTVTDSFGHQLRFEYDAQGRIATVTDPAGQLYRYTYDAAGNLVSRQTPENRTDTYLYENPGFPHALTGVMDGNGVRTDTTWYDEKGRAVSSEADNGINRLTVAYGEANSASVTDLRNVTHGFTYELVEGVLKATGMTRSCPTCGTATRSFTRDANGNITSRTDYNGIRTTYEYDLTRNLETSRTEAVGTPQQRTVTTEWHATLNVPVKITEPGRVTAMAYDGNGNMTSLSVTDTATNEVRTWNYTYGNYGLLASRTLPSGESVSYAYDANGFVTTATTSGGLVTQYLDYDANGRVGKIVYPGGRTVAFTYDGIGRVLTRSETVANPASSDGPSWWQTVIDWLRRLFGGEPLWPDAQGDSGTAVTSYSYDAAGLLTDIALPDGEQLHYEYDAAYRVILARDALGNTIRIIRDPYGKPLETQLSDPSGVLAQTLVRSYDELGRLSKVLGHNGQQLTQRYDEEGYLLEQTNALGQRHQRGRDALYRTTSLTDADNRTTAFDFDPLDHLTAVTDARGHTTSYGRNAFGEAVTEYSPDRGNTLREFDHGRLKRSTDARGITHEFAYDADGRVTTRTSPNSRVTYRYDEGELGQGRLTGLDDDSGSTNYRYNSQGFVVEKTSTINDGPTLKVGYGYTLGGKLKEIATPGKHLVRYGYDAQGRLNSVTVDGTVLLNQPTFGPTGVTGWTWGNGELRRELYDQDGRITQIASGSALQRSYGYDTADRITSLVDAKAGVNDSYGYDAVGRLTAQQGTSMSFSYGYDALGNRTQKQQSILGSSLVVTSYSIDADSNRLLGETTGNKTKAYSYLPSGQLSSDGMASYRYNDDGRLAEVSGPRPLRNAYNALGQRVRKAGQGVTVFAYDEAGHLLGEYTPGGVAIREYVWLGNRLVGMLSQQEKGVLYVHTDHLGTPRAVSAQSTVLWRWEGEAFGASLPHEQVAGPSRKFSLPLRFPGQYYDSETGLFYNTFRDYSPATGRYVESDPIGLSGGLNTYEYVDGNPTGFSDQNGLATTIIYVGPSSNEVFPHSALHIGGRNASETFLYDPAGSYRVENLPRAPGDFFTGDQANLDSYVRYWTGLGNSVSTVTLNTTSEQEQQISQRAIDLGGVSPGLCAAAVSTALGGVCGVQSSSWPPTLIRNASNARCP